MCRVKAIASSVERLLRYANCSGSSEAGRSLYCALFLHKNELFLTVDIENDACVPPGVIS